MRCTELILIIAVTLVTVSLVVGTVYMIVALIQIKKTTKEFESAIHKINAELDVVHKVSDKAMSITGKLSSPVVSAVSLLFYAFSIINKRKKRCMEGGDE